MKQYPVTSARRWRINHDDLPTETVDDCLQQFLPAKLGSGRSATYQLDNDLSYISTQYQTKQDLAVITQMQHQEPRLVVTLALKGQSMLIDDRGHQVIFNEGQTTITAFNAFAGERHYQANSSMAQLRFSMAKSWLDRYFGEQASRQLFRQSGVLQLSNKPITHQGLLAAKQLLDAKVEPPLKRLFMHGQAMSILAAEISHLWCDSSAKLSHNEKDKALANAARSILQNEFKQPPSVAELAKTIGTNQFKLKQLFHDYFNNTPYGMLLDIRMQTAYQLLANNRCPIDVAANYVGYKHASNFSAAFSKFYGISPSLIAKKAK